jgi:hypothetical protein
MMSRLAIAAPAVTWTAVTVAIWPWLALTTPLTSPVVEPPPPLPPSDGADGLSLHPVIVITTPASIASTDSRVNSRREIEGLCPRVGDNR